MGNCSSGLRRAMRRRDTDGVRSILEQAGETAPDLIDEDFTADCILDSCTKNLNPVMHTALSTGQHAVLELLFQHGGDPDIRSRTYGQTILMRAAYLERLEAAQLAVSYGTSVSETDNDGNHALHMAAASLVGRARSSIRVMCYLVEDAGKDTDINIRDGSGNTPLHLAARCGHAAAVEYLMTRGADISAKNDYGQTPTDLASHDFREHMRKNRHVTFQA